MKRKENYRLPPGWPVRDGTFARWGKLGLVITFLMLFAMAVVWAADKPAQNDGKEPAPVVPPAAPQAAPARVPYALDWHSFNSGGASYGTSATRNLGYSVGQTVSGFGTSGSNNLGIGFWHGSCVAEKGDMNADGVHTGPDVVLLLNCVYLGTGLCDVCFADVNCDGILTGPDVVLLLNRTYLGSTAPPWCGN